MINTREKTTESILFSIDKIGEIYNTKSLFNLLKKKQLISKIYKDNIKKVDNAISKYNGCELSEIIDYEIDFILSDLENKLDEIPTNKLSTINSELNDLSELIKSELNEQKEV